MFNLSIYSVTLLVHVVAGTILIGGSLFAPLIHKSMVTADSLGALRMWVNLARKSASANPATALVILGTGLYLGSQNWWTQPWFYVASAAWLLDSLLAVLVINPAVAGLGAAIGSREGAIDAKIDARRRSRTWELAGEVTRGSDLSMLYVMFVKPGLIESCVVVVVAIALFVAINAGRSRITSAQRQP